MRPWGRVHPIALDLITWALPLLMAFTFGKVIVELAETFPARPGFNAADAGPQVLRTGVFLLRTAIFATITALLQTILGLAAALSVLWAGPRPRVRLLLITLFMLPYAIPSSLIGLSFKFALGAEGWIAAAAEAALGWPRDTLLGPNKLAVAGLASVWQFFPFAFLLFFLSLKSTPQAQLRSARLDGAPAAAMLIEIVLGRIWVVALSILFLRLAFMLVKYDTPFVFTVAMASEDDVATVELAKLLQGSSSLDLVALAWSLLGLSLAVVTGYLLVERWRRREHMT